MAGQSATSHKLRVAAVRKLAGPGIEIVLDVPLALAEAYKFKPGQHVAVRAAIDGTEQVRTYTICSGSTRPLRLGIKHIPGGIFSTWANTQLKAGDTLDVALPQGRFTLTPHDGSAWHFLMLAAGAGITPILGMATEALELEPQSRVTLVYQTRTAAQAMFLDEVEDLKDRFPTRLDMLHILTGDGEAETELQQGRLTGEKLKALAARRISMPSVTRAYLCGPGSFIKDTRNALFELGMARDAVAHEFFVGRTGAAAPQPAVPVAAPQPATAANGNVEAVAILDGQRHKFTLAPGQHVLEAVLAQGIKAPYACTAGMCSTCRARVVDGKVAMTVNYSLEPWEIERGFVLTCQAVTKSTSLVIDYDAM